MEVSGKLFDYLQDVEESMPIANSPDELVGCKIVGVDFVAEDLSENSPVVAILLYLERPNGTKFQLDCSAMVLDKKYQEYFDCAHILLGKSEFPGDTWN